jgi:predicted ArsR family transcriptional regulator
MSDDFVSSDTAILDLLRGKGPMTVADLEEELAVTATAVRQRLTRLLARGYIERTAEKHGRGRPCHRYRLTEKGARQAGSNLDDLAIVLWQELREIDDPEVRRGLMKRVAKRLAVMYAGELPGDTLQDRMNGIAALFAERRVPVDVEESGPLPVLKAKACPYPDLAEHDRDVCAMEGLLLSELLHADVKLDACRLDGATCCSFRVEEEVSP